MKKPSQQAARIIAKMGGPTVLAGRLGVAKQTVYRWTYSRENGGTGGIIPAIATLRILALAKRRRVKLTTLDWAP